MSRAPRLVLRAQRAWRRLVQLPRWMIHCEMLWMNDRLFVFRSAPTWFVAYCATLDGWGEPDEADPFFAQATAELRLRREVRRLRRAAQ